MHKESSFFFVESKVEESIDTSSYVKRAKSQWPWTKKVIYKKFHQQQKRFSIYRSPTQKFIYNEEASREGERRMLYFLRVRRPGL
jgi:hypothetical protein